VELKTFQNRKLNFKVKTRSTIDVHDPCTHASCLAYNSETKSHGKFKFDAQKSVSKTNEVVTYEIYTG